MAASAPSGSRRTSPRAAVAAAGPAPASPRAIGYRFSCLSLGAQGRARPTPPGRNPGLDFATFPTPAGEAGGIQAQLGGREEVRRSPATAAAEEEGVQARGSRQQVSRGRPPATPCLTSCAFKFRPAPLSLQSLPHSQNHNKNKT